MQRHTLSQAGTFSERAGGLFRTILASGGNGELGTGIGLTPKEGEFGVIIEFSGYTTMFRAREVRSLLEIITETISEEEAYSRAVGGIFDALVADLTSLAEEIEALEREKTDEALNETKH